MSWNRSQIVDLLCGAAEIALRTKTSLRRQFKADRSLVTQADQEIEDYLADVLEDPAAGNYFIGEETFGTKGNEYLEKAFQHKAYVVDPIDGTVPYAYQLPTWGISIGLMDKGTLVDGAVYLVEFGELLISDGDAVLEGRRQGDVWDWRELPKSLSTDANTSPVAITQRVAKHGRVFLPNPVMVFGAAVVPLVGLLQQRFIGYLGSVKLWDIAGALPLLLRRGFCASVLVGEEVRPVTAQVDNLVYDLEPTSPERWRLRNDFLVCRPEDELRFRSAFVNGEGRVD